jgi:hypothetical protein
MSILSSIITLGMVAGMGWFTIYYLIPKIESGELGAIGLGAPKAEAEAEAAPAAEGEGEETGLITDELMSELAGGGGEETPTPAEEEKTDGRISKGGGVSRGGKKSKNEYRIIQYLWERY